MRRLHRGYFIAFVVLVLAAVAVSAVLFPAWRQSATFLFILLVVAVIGVVAFLANWRTAFENKPKAQPRRPSARRTQKTKLQADATILSGRDTSIGGDVVGGDKTSTTNITYEAAAPPAFSLHQLPPPPPDFTGRVAELKDLLDHIEQGATISGLQGLGGVGKTALALKLAEKLSEKYPDAQFYLDLKGASEQKALTVAEALAHVVRAYYPDSKLPDDEAQLRGLYQSVLHDQHALLLMDNASDRAQVEPLMPPASCCLIVTSRQHFTLPGLHQKNLDTLPPDDARELLLKIADRIGQSADEIAKLCGCLPLALRAAGSALQERVDLSPADYLRRLQDESQRLQLEGTKAEGVPISVAASFGLSYDLLTDELQKLWRKLAVFPDSFDRLAPAAVWELDEDKTLDALSELVKYSLLDWLPSPVGALPDGRGAGGEARYRLHDLARLFAHSRLADSERHAAQQRQAAHYETVLRSARKLYEKGGENITRGLALFDLEWPNIQTGQAWAVANTEKDRSAAQLCNDYPDAGVYVLSLRQHPREQIRWLEAALAAARQLKDREAEGVHLGNLGLAYADLGDARKAIGFYEQRLVIAREIGNQRGEGAALGNLGNAYLRLGDARKAIEF